jgi:hypothetical protein
MKVSWLHQWMLCRKHFFNPSKGLKPNTCHLHHLDGWPPQSTERSKGKDFTHEGFFRLDVVEPWRPTNPLWRGTKTKIHQRWTTERAPSKTDRSQGQMSVYLTWISWRQGYSWNMYVDWSDAQTQQHDMIIGRDLLHELGIDLLFSLGVIKNGTMQLYPQRSLSQLRGTNFDDFEDWNFQHAVPAALFC